MYLFTMVLLRNSNRKMRLVLPPITVAKSSSTGSNEYVVPIFIQLIILGKIYFMLLLFLCQQRFHVFFWKKFDEELLLP